MVYSYSSGQYISQRFEIGVGNVFETFIDPVNTYYQFSIDRPIPASINGRRKILPSLERNVNVWAVFSYGEFRMGIRRLQAADLVWVLEPDLAFAMASLHRDLGSPDGIVPPFKLSIHGPIGLSGMINTRQGRLVIP